MKILFKLCLVFLTLGCSIDSKKKGIWRDGELVSYKESKESTLSISKFAENIEYIVLEAADDSFLGEISKVELSGGRVFVLDREVLEMLFVFNRKGEFLFKIETGLGAEGELRSIQDFVVDSQSKKLYVADSDLRRILVFDWNGNYVNTIETDSFIDNISILPNGDLVVFRNITYSVFDEFDNNQILVFDNSGGVKKKFLPLSESEVYPAFYESMQPFIQTESHLYFGSALSEQIYEIDDEECHVAFSFDFGEKSIVRKAEALKNTAQFEPILNSGKFVMPVGHNYVSDSNLISFLRHGAIYEILHWNRLNQVNKVYKKLDNDIDGMDNFIPISQIGNIMVGYIPAELIMALPIERRSDLLPVNLQKMLVGYGTNQETLNPILMLLRMK